MKKQLITFLLVAGVFSWANGQELLNSKYAQSIRHSESGNVKRVVFAKHSFVSVDQSMSLLREIDLSNNQVSYVLDKSEIDRKNVQHDSYKRIYLGIPVDLEVYKVHSKSGIIKSANGEYSKLNLPQVLPAFISEHEALQKALAYIGAETYAWETNAELNPKPTAELVILPKTITRSENAHFAYKIDIFAVQPLSRHWVYVDAEKGNILFKDPIIKHVNYRGEHPNLQFHHAEILPENASSILVEGTGDTRYSGIQNFETLLQNDKYILYDESRNIHVLNSNQTYLEVITEFEDDDNLWTSEEYDNEYKDNAALDVMFGMAKTYDYFKEKFNRNSYDNLGSLLLGFVHLDYKYDNAFWGGDFMGYGDGSSNGEVGNGYFDALVSIDVTAHEIGHGICQETAGLIYEREYGALNEGLSDIWAAVVEQYAAPNDPNKDPWIIGEEIDRRWNSVGLRSMKDPKIKGHPNTYKGQFWRPATYEECPYPDYYENDYCGVHSNSGVLNYWFYLLTEGGSGTNDLNDVYNVQGIGMEKAAEIIYCAETNYFTYNTTYPDAVDHTTLCAEELFGEESSEMNSLQNAWYAVGLADQILAINDLKQEEFFIYPNPVKDFLYVQAKSGKIHYTVISISGQILQKGILENGRINTQKLPKGNYILQVENGVSKKSYPFIKN